GGRLIAYTPHTAHPGPMALRVDATELYRRGFRAITTPAGPRAGPICRLFKRHGFRTVLVDLPDPGNRAALGEALRLRRCVDGYVVGDGGLAAGRYAQAVLAEVMTRVRARSG